jgi:hypothetical protein
MAPPHFNLVRKFISDPTGFWRATEGFPPADIDFRKKIRNNPTARKTPAVSPPHLRRRF